MLKKLSLTFVDIETTGCSPTGDRIIDIGIVKVQDGKIVTVFESLINPQKSVPHSIELLTGISNDDLPSAPLFEDIAHTIKELLHDSIFVAHNARFDYGFIKNEFKRIGVDWSSKCLCTVRLSRELFPRYAHHDMDSIVKRFNLTCSQRHRALPDAQAIWDYFNAVAIQHGEQFLADGVYKMLQRPSTPPHLNKDIIDSLPETAGVYMFYGAEKEILYVGKSNNIKRRVLSHFSGDHRTNKEMNISQQVTHIETKETAGELGALILESIKIKEMMPAYNRLSRKRKELVVARKKKTPEGYFSLELEHLQVIDPSDLSTILGVFKTKQQAKEFLMTQAKEYNLCHKLLDLEQGKGPCFHYGLEQCKGACIGEEERKKYNSRFDEAMKKNRIVTWPFAGAVMINEKKDDLSGQVFFIHNWCLIESFSYSPDGYEPFVEVQGKYFDYDAYKIISRYLLDKKNKKNVKPVTKKEFKIMLQGLNPSYEYEPAIS